MKQPLLKPIRTDWRKTFFRASVAFVALFCVAETARAQAIFGTVKTVAGVPIEGVLVRATKSFPFAQFTTTTDFSGGYVVGSGLSGTYEVRAIEATYTFTPATTDVTVSGSSEQVNFTSPSTVPVAATESATDVSATSATLRGSVNPNGGATTAYFEYGLTASYGSVSGSVNVGNDTNSEPVSISVSNLLNGTNYHFRMVANNSHGTRTGSDNNFTTLLPGIPSVTTAKPTDGGATTMRLNGSVVPNGANVSAWFEWGATTNYGNVTASQALGSGTTTTNFSQVLMGLVTAATYHYRAVVATSFATNYGADVLFTPVFSDIAAGLPGASGDSVEWGDYDNDGRLDLLFAGAVWRNTGNGFTAYAYLPGILGFSGWAAGGDYDNDGRLDVLLAGFVPTYGIAQVWRNTGSGFANINVGLTGVFSSFVAWGDYDNDGRLDFLLTGMTSGAGSPSISQLWRNTGYGFANINAGLPGISGGSVAWGDYDNDGRLDLLLTGTTSTGADITQVWRNTGNADSAKRFVNVGAGLPGVHYSSAAWGDYDNDGRLDILLTGSSFQDAQSIAQVWRNTGNGFTNINAGLTGIVLGSAAWGDYDNDGRLDILLSGNRGGRFTEVWRNTGSGFANINAGLPGVSSVAWGDYDNDGRLDIVLAGTQVWRNNTLTTNSPPTAPSGLALSVSNTTLTLTWNASADNETPAAGLTYNLRIGTTPGGSEVLSPMSGANGFRRLAQLGGAQHGLSAMIEHYSVGTPYYWSVQAVDSAFAGSPFAPESSFKFQPVQIPVTATNVTPGDFNGDGVVSQSELDAVLANYWPYSPWLYMTNVAGLGASTVTFALTNSIAGAFGVEYTTNFLDWFFLGPATPRYLFTDGNAPAQPQRYYRLVWPLNTNASPPQPAGLISWWRAENNTMDSRGNNHGTAQGTVNYSPGAVGQGFSLAGSGYIDIANPTLNADASGFTIAGWFVIHNTSGQPSLLDFRGAGNNHGFVLGQDASGNMDFFVFKAGGGGAFTLVSSTGWLLDTPYFIAATFDGSTMTIYRNGNAVATRNDPADTMRTVLNPTLQIGRNVVNGTQWNGQIDEVQFYDHALTQAEVGALMSGPGP